MRIGDGSPNFAGVGAWVNATRACLSSQVRRPNLPGALANTLGVPPGSGSATTAAFGPLLAASNSASSLVTEYSLTAGSTVSASAPSGRMTRSEGNFGRAAGGRMRPPASAPGAGPSSAGGSVWVIRVPAPLPTTL